jgi:phosphopantothenoylcysteine decarboxylase/phosphopantothenate--cysteine ligase
MLTGKNIVLGVTGGIAAWRACPLLIELVLNRHANVDVIMTEHAEQFITERSLRSLSHNLVTRDVPTNYKESGPAGVKHISLARKADLLLVAPATANIIGKVANGIADNQLSTTIMATRAPVVFCPAMNDQMYDNPIVQENIEKLKRFGYEFLEPKESVLAYGGVGKGAMADVDEIVDYVVKRLLGDEAEKS